MKYTFTRKQIVNAFNNKILDDDNFLTYLLSTTSKDRPMNQKSLDKKKPKELDCWDKVIIPSHHVLWAKEDESTGGVTVCVDIKKIIENVLTQQRTELLEEIFSDNNRVIDMSTHESINTSLFVWKEIKKNITNLLNKKDAK